MHDHIWQVNEHSHICERESFNCVLNVILKISNSANFKNLIGFHTIFFSTQIFFKVKYNNEL